MNPILGAAAAAGMLAAAVAFWRPNVVAPFLAATTFTHSLAIGSVAVGRAAAPIALIAALTTLIRSPSRLRLKGAVAIALAYGLLAFASLLWTVDLAMTLDELVALMVGLIYMAVFAFSIQDRRDVQAVLWAVAVSSVVFGLLWITGYAGGADRRFNATGEPNLFALQQIVALPMLLALSSSVKSWAAKAFLYAAVAIVGGSIVSTLSRGGLLTLVVVIVVVLALPSRTLFRSPVAKVAFFATAAIGLGALLSVAWADVSQRFELAQTEGGLAGGRLDLSRAAIRGFQSNPVTGLGFGGFRSVSFQLIRTTPGASLVGHVRYETYGGEYAHNAYLGSLADLGPVGLLLFAALLATVAGSLVRTSRRARADSDHLLYRSANAVAVSLLALAVASLALSTETSRTLWMIVGLSVALARLQREQQESTLPEAAEAHRLE